MTQPTKEDGLRALFRDLKERDAERAPSVDALLREARERAERRSWWRRPAVPISLGLAGTGAAAIATMVLFLQFQGGSPERARGQRARSLVPEEPLASLLARPGLAWEGFETSPIPKRRLIGGWE
jgi:hypothetical protein